MELELVNLQDLNLVELNAQEVLEVEGGDWPGIGWFMDCGFGYGGGGSRNFYQNLLQYYDC